MTTLITAARLFALCANARSSMITSLAPALEEDRVAFGVSTPLRVCHAVAQFAVETASFRTLEENLNYTHVERIAAVWPRRASRADELVNNPQKLANAVYAFKNGNGPESSGDGWKFRGRSPVMITGAANYSAAQRGTGSQLLTCPDLASDPEVGARIALWFFQTHGCNELADADDADAITRKINGPGMQQASVRRDLAHLAKSIFI